MPKVFSKIGRTEISMQAERFIQYIQRRGGQVPYAEAYRYVHSHFPDAKDFEGMLTGAIRAGYLQTVATTEGMFIKGLKAKRV
jgi:hypothetical protein